MLNGAEETIIGKGEIRKEIRRFAPMTFQFVFPSSGFTFHLHRSCFVSHTKEIGPNYMYISSLVLTLINIFHYLCLGYFWSTLACNYRMMSFFCIFMWSPQGDPSIYLGFYAAVSIACTISNSLGFFYSFFILCVCVCVCVCVARRVHVVMTWHVRRTETRCADLAIAA